MPGSTSSDQEKSSSVDVCSDQVHKDGKERDILVGGFTAITVAAVFIASIQGSIMSITVGQDEKTASMRAVNAFFLGGLILDIFATNLAFLTARWFERLTKEEQDLLEHYFSNCQQQKDGLLAPRLSESVFEALFYRWLGLSLFVPLPLLVVGIACMLTGLYIYVWTQHSLVVGIMVSIAGVACLPFMAGVFYIGRDRDRRRKLIHQLSIMRGDW